MENIITFNSSMACVDYVKKIKPQEDILSSEDRKNLFKARQYFITNLNEFTDNDIEFLLINEYFKNFTNLQVESLIIKCNSENKSLPAFIKQWENCEIHILTPYLQKIANKDPEQLKSYFSYEKGKNIILDIFHEKKSDNNVLTDLAIKYDPVNVLKSNWKPEKIVNWLDFNPEHSLKIAEHFISNPTKYHNPLIQDKVFELIILGHIKHKKLILEKVITTNMPLTVFISSFGNAYIEKFKLLDYDFLDKLMKKPILFIEDTDSVNNSGRTLTPSQNTIVSTKSHKPLMTLNLAQYTYIKHTREWQINKAENILSNFSKDILKPIEVEVNLYSSREKIFPYFFKNNSLDINFSIGLKQEFAKLNADEQQMYTASCMHLLIKQFGLSERTQKLAELLEVVPSKMANLYFSKAIDSLNPDVAALVSSHLLKYSLDKTLNDNIKKTKQPKI